MADGRKLPWFGPPMSAPSMATARLMETWAHSLDVADALGVDTDAVTARLRSIAHIGVRTRDYAYAVNGLTPPTEPFHVALTAPDGSVWTWGPEDAAQQVSGSARALLHARHATPTTLGTRCRRRRAPTPSTWLTIAQAFAGPPGPGR